MSFINEANHGPPGFSRKAKSLQYTVCVKCLHIHSQVNSSMVSEMLFRQKYKKKLQPDLSISEKPVISVPLPTMLELQGAYRPSFYIIISKHGDSQ